tara:strand:+ start:421 stop:1338 length:918 start_codon:yes stop_codon:yes gene_type:complete
MATPNMPSNSQAIIDKFLTGNFQTTDSTNPYIVPVDPYVPPADDPKDTIPNCSALFPDENRVYDPLSKSCVLVPEEKENNRDREDKTDTNEDILRKMRNDPNTGYGASNILDDYITQGLGQGTFLKFDPDIGRLGAGVPNPFLNIGGGLLDALFGGEKRRLNKYNDALKFMEDNAYGQSVGNDLFKIFTPQEYYRNVSGNLLDPNAQRTPQGQNITVGEAVEAAVNNDYSDVSSGGSPIAEDLSGGLLYTSPLTSVDARGNRTRNDAAYRAGIARNIERNKKNLGTSGFSMNVGGTGRAGFTRGR